LRPATSKRTDADGNEKVHVFGYNAHAVFHAGQVDGYDMPPEPERVRPAHDERGDIADAFTFAAGIGARVDESDYAGASYSPTFDRVMMPERDRFDTGDGAWSTMTHELTHWTGHESRLARTYGKRFGDDAYAAEELVAELGAAFTLAAIGRTSEPRADHAHYLASWLRVLRADPSRLWSAAGHADRAANYLIEHATIGAPREMVPA
jgi:antirestriction protein ArdC